MVGLKTAAIHKYENDIVVNLKRSMIDKLAAALNCSPIYLMGWEDASGATDVTLIELDTKLSEHESELIAKYQQLNDDGQQYVRDTVDMIASTDKYLK